MGEEIRKSDLLRQSVLTTKHKDQENELKKSLLENITGDGGEGNASGIRESKLDVNQLIDRRADQFKNVVSQLLAPESVEDLMGEYIKALKGYEPKNQETLSQLLGISRQVLSVLHGDPTIDLSAYDKKLKSALEDFYRHSEPERNPNRKVFKF